MFPGVEETAGAFPLLSAGGHCEHFTDSAAADALRRLIRIKHRGTAAFFNI